MTNNQVDDEKQLEYIRKHYHFKLTKRFSHQNHHMIIIFHIDTKVFGMMNSDKVIETNKEDK